MAVEVAANPVVGGRNLVNKARCENHVKGGKAVMDISLL